MLTTEDELDIATRINIPPNHKTLRMAIKTGKATHTKLRALANMHLTSRITMIQKITKETMRNES